MTMYPDFADTGEKLSYHYPMETKSESRTLALGLTFAFILAVVAVVLFTLTGPDTTLYQAEWIPSLQIPFALQFDGLSLLFAVVISGIGAVIFTYSAVYMQNAAHPLRFLVTLLCFALSMLGLVLADHIILLFVFWELTSLTSYFLIATNYTSETARKNALQAMLVTGAGGLVLLAGLIWMGVEGGSFLLSDLLTGPESVLASPHSTAILLLIVIGCMAKSAQFPLHFWLPNAMVAPTPVSAYLHSAAMVKAGIYLLARVQPILGMHDLWTPLLATVGSITALWAALLALRQDDLKQMLAYTTLVALGILTLLLAFPSGEMATAAMTFMLTHALYKAALFMWVGIVETHTGTRKLSELKNLKMHFPKLYWISVIATASMAGVPLFLGFIAKDTIYTAAMQVPYLAIPLITLLVIINALMLIAAYIFAIRPLSGDATAIQQTPAPRLLLWIPTAALAAFGVLLGILPWLIGNGLIQPAATAVFGLHTTLSLSLWHGVVPFLLSLCTLALGIAAIWKLERIMPWMAKLTTLPRWPIEPVYFTLLRALDNIAYRVTITLHQGSPGLYIRIIIAVIAASLLTAVWLVQDLAKVIPSFPVAPDWIGVSISILAAAGAWMAARATSKIMALASLGASGFAMAGIFLLHGALDVAMTQLLVETLVVVLAAAVFWRHPDFTETQAWDVRQNYTDLLIASATGFAVYLALCSTLAGPLDLSLTYFFENASYALAHGRNIVNVIIVDFRGFDTFGEATVLVIAALGLRALTKPLLNASKEST